MKYNIETQNVTDKFENTKTNILLGQQPLVPLLLLGPPFFLIILFGTTTLLSGMTGISLYMQWPLTYQPHGSFSQREQLFFCYGSNSTPFKKI
jgi:hypothetical protein